MADAAIRALAALRRVRRVETDEARRLLAEALAEETAAMTRHGAIARETEAARRLPETPDREIFAAWLARMAAERARLTEALRAAAARVAAARLDLAKRRVAETAAGDALARAMAERAADFARRDQITLEDVARAARRAAGP